MKHIATLLLFFLTVSIFSFSQSNDKIVSMNATTDFPILTREGQASNRRPYAPFHIEKDINALAGDDLNFTFHIAAAEGRFPGKAGKYTVRLNTLTERDGECVYNVYVNDEPVGLFQKNPPTNEFHAPAMLQWTNVNIPAKAKIRVESNNWSNLQRHELNFFEYARGRWTGVDFILEVGVDNATQKSLNIGIFEKTEDVGSLVVPAEARYNKIEQAYYVIADGKSADRNRENFGYLWKTTQQDFTLEALVSLLGLTDKPDRKAGLMIRKSTNPDAPFVACFLQGNDQVAIQYRIDPGTEIQETSFNIEGAEMIQVEKKGSNFTVSAAQFGDEYERQSIEVPTLSGTVKAGFYVCSGSSGDREMARFSHLRFFENIIGK